MVGSAAIETPIKLWLTSLVYNCGYRGTQHFIVRINSSNSNGKECFVLRSVSNIIRSWITAVVVLPMYFFDCWFECDGFCRAQKNNKHNNRIIAVYVGHEGYLIEKVGILCSVRVWLCLKWDACRCDFRPHQTIHDDIYHFCLLSVSIRSVRVLSAVFIVTVSFIFQVNERNERLNWFLIETVFFFSRIFTRALCELPSISELSILYSHFQLHDIQLRTSTTIPNIII